ncbi:MAG: hypothetical protein RL215_281 [Planctomycetota bacterium]
MLRKLISRDVDVFHQTISVFPALVSNRDHQNRGVLQRTCIRFSCSVSEAPAPGVTFLRRIWTYQSGQSGEKMKHKRLQNKTFKVCLLRLLRSECGAMQVAEYLLMGTVITLGVVVGLATYRDSVVLEYGDAAAALQSIRQTYSFTLTGGTTSSFTDGATNLSNSVGVSVSGSPEP